MRFIIGLFLIFSFVLSATAVVGPCIETRTDGSFFVDTASHAASAEQGEENHDGCPTDCHSRSGHCHGGCHQFFNLQLVGLSKIDVLKHKISAVFHAPLSPYLEGNRKPPKAS